MFTFVNVTDLVEEISSKLLNENFEMSVYNNVIKICFDDYTTITLVKTHKAFIDNKIQPVINHITIATPKIEDEVIIEFGDVYEYELIFKSLIKRILKYNIFGEIDLNVDLNDRG